MKYLPKGKEESEGIQLFSLNMKEENELFHPSNSISNTGLGTNELANNKFRVDIGRRLQTTREARREDYFLLETVETKEKNIFKIWQTYD